MRSQEKLGEEAEQSEEEEQVQEEKKESLPPQHPKSPSQKSFGRNPAKTSGWFGAITSWFSYSKEEDLPDEQDLITMLDAEKVKLDLRIIEYQKATKNIEYLFLQQRKDYQKSIISWKRQMVKNQITRAKDILEYWNNHVKSEFDFKQLENTEI